MKADTFDEIDVTSAGGIIPAAPPLPKATKESGSSLFETPKNNDSKDVIINDVRLKFNKETFSGYCSVTTANAFSRALFSGKIEDALYWSAELVASGKIDMLWDRMVEFYCEKVHLENPRLLHVLAERAKRLFQTKSNMVNTPITNDAALGLRNNLDARKYIAELVTLLCLSNKEMCVIPPVVEVSRMMEVAGLHMKADHENYGRPYKTEDDPVELRMPLNEFIFALTVARDWKSVAFWLIFLSKFVQLSKKNKHFVTMSSRDYTEFRDMHVFLTDKQARHISWLVWRILLDVSSRCGTFVHVLCKDAFLLYARSTTDCTFNKRMNLLLHAAALILRPVQTTVPLIRPDQEKWMMRVYDCLPEIYRRVKQFEKIPETNYLFASLAEMS